MSKHSKLLIIGAGGQGRVIADIASQTGNYDEIAFLDDREPDTKMPFPYLGKTDCVQEYRNTYDMIVAIGNAQVRETIMDRLVELGVECCIVVAPSAVIGSDVVIGAGSVIMHGAIINTGTSVGRGVIVNTASSVDHDCVLEDFCHIAVGAHLCGTVYVGKKTWVGAGSTVTNNISVCSDCVIGAGAVVVKDIETSGTYLGVPARRKN